MHPDHPSVAAVNKRRGPPNGIDFEYKCGTCQEQDGDLVWVVD